MRCVLLVWVLSAVASVGGCDSGSDAGPSPEALSSSEGATTAASTTGMETVVPARAGAAAAMGDGTEDATTGTVSPADGTAQDEPMTAPMMATPMMAAPMMATPMMGSMAGAGGTAPGDGDAPDPGMDPAAGEEPVDVAMSDDDGACDRACLIEFMSGYIDALIANDPAQLPVSENLKYTENGELSELGDPVWGTATELVADTRLDFADPVEGQVASHFVFNEGSTPVIYQVRLKVSAREITEIETMAVRRQGAANGFFNVSNMKPEQVFFEVPSQPVSREELKQITELYLDYLEGEKHGRDLPFAEDCIRYENGVATASGRGTFEAQSFWRFQVTRRILVIDEEAGITWGMFPFSQSARALVVGEAFKIMDGEFKMIQAVMANQPAKAWD